jgi:parallel beta-helix repeat protein
MSELDKIFALLLIALIVLVSIIGVVWYHTSNVEEGPSPFEPSFPPEHGPVPEPFNCTLSINEFAVVQGESFSITLYMTSLVSKTDATTSFSWYLGDYQDEPWSPTKPVPLEIIFDPNQPILKYNETKTIIITINSAEDAPLGKYRINLELNASPDGSSFHGYRNLWITIIPSGSSTIIVPENYSTIQEAIDNAEENGIIYVMNGTYNENLTIKKSLSLIGENSHTTIIDGENNGTGILVQADNVTIQGFTVKNGDSPTPYHYTTASNTHGIHLLHVENCNISNNVVEYSGHGIWLYGSSNNYVFGNNCSNNWDGIKLDLSYNNQIIDNKLETNRFGMRLSSSTNNYLRNNYLNENKDSLLISGSFLNDVDSSNRLNNKPIYFWVNQSDKTIPTDAGIVILVNCNKITIENLTLENDYYGIILSYTQNTTIMNNQIKDNYYGIWLYYSNYTQITQNELEDNGYVGAIHSHFSSNNNISNNNFRNNFYGLKLIHSSFNNISENQIETTRNEAIAIFDSCKYNNIKENNIVNNRGGIWFQNPTSHTEEKYSNYNIIVGNNIDSNTDWGILLQPTIQNTFTENNIANNGKGVHLNSIEKSNEFYLNNFVNNTIQVEHYGVATWNKVSKGNYWDDYTGVDDNQDGKGDTPYIIDENNQDSYPLINPYVSP